MVYQVISSIFSNTSVENIAFEDNQPAQAAVSFQVDNGRIFRIARDYQKEAWHLSQMDPGTKKFTSLETDQSSILEWLKKETGGLDENERRLLFMLDRHRLPSYAGGRVYSKLTDVSAGNAPSFMEKDRSTSKKDPALEEERSQLEIALKNAEKKLDDMVELEDEMLLKQDQAAAIEKRIALVEEMQQKIVKMEAVEKEKFSVFIQDGMMSTEQEQAYETGQAALDNALEDLDMESESLEAQLILKGRGDSKKNILVMIGGAIAGISFFLPFIVTLVGPARFIFLAGFLGGSALALFGYFKSNRMAADKKKLEVTFNATKEKGRQLERQFDKEQAMVLALIKKTGAKDISDLNTRQKNYVNLKEKKSAAIQKVKETLAEGTVETLKNDAKQLDGEVNALKEQLKEHQSISEEVYRLQERLREIESSPQNPDSVFGEFPGLETTVPDVQVSDMTSIMNIGGAAPAERQKRLERDAAIVYRRFRPKNTEAIRFNEQGALFVGETPLSSMSEGTADQVVISVSLSAISQFPEITFPLLIDDAFSSLDHLSQTSALRILEIISKKRQVIFFTRQINTSEMGHTFELASGY